MTGVPPDWYAAALDPPCAHGGPAGRAELKASAEDFVVAERLGFAADGGTAHVLLEVEKRGRDTLAVARELARSAGVAARDVGFAGLKDRVALATQWFTVPAAPGAPAWAGLEGPGYRVLCAAPHSRKLRRGALAGNAFRVRLHALEAAGEALAARLAAVAERGVPNYFGSQRFGRAASNLASVARFADEGTLPRGREGRGFVLSAARSLVFNALLAERVRAGNWDRLLPGELVNLAGRQSWFASETIDEVLAGRAALHDVHPTGPLAGRGRVPAGEAGALEQGVLERFGALVARLEGAGVEGARRSLRLVPEDFRAVVEPGTLTLEFRLPPGAYATVVVRELLATDAVPSEGDDD